MLNNVGKQALNDSLVNEKLSHRLRQSLVNQTFQIKDENFHPKVLLFKPESFLFMSSYELTSLCRLTEKRRTAEI